MKFLNVLKKLKFFPAFLAIVLLTGNAKGQNLADALSDAVNYLQSVTQIQGSLGRYISCDFRISENSAITFNKSTPKITRPCKKTNVLGTVQFLCFSGQYMINFGGEAVIDNGLTYSINSNSTVIVNPEIVDLLTISLKKSDGTTQRFPMRNSTTTVTKTENPSEGVVRKYEFRATVNNKTVRVTLLLGNFYLGG